VPFVGKKAPERDECKVKGGVNHNVLRLGSPEHSNAIEQKFISGMKDILLSDSVGSTAENLAQAAISSANIHLPKKCKPRPEWWVDAALDLEPSRDARNRLQGLWMAQRKKGPVHELLSRQHKRAVTRFRHRRKKAKNDWISRLMDELEVGLSGGEWKQNPWDVVKRIQSGITKVKPRLKPMMTRSDGIKATTEEENITVFTDHLKKLLQRVPQVDEAVLDEVPQQPYPVEAGRLPTVDEIDAAARQLNFSGSGFDGITAHMWKAIARDNDLFFDHVVKHVHSFWVSEELPSGWEIVEATMLPKKGNLSLPGNWRSIIKIVIPQKVVLNLLRSQLEPICESLPHEEQCGFRKLRGCIDAIFNVRLGLKKRQEHNLETVALFVDFVKAFDRVPRDMLWKVLSKLGVPDKLVRLIAVLHSKAVVRLDGTDVESSNGVRQGCILGPILFLF
jgi:hypothetical protein